MYRLKPFILTAIWSGIILVLSVLPGKKIPKVGLGFFDQSDKIAHILVYALLTFILGFEIFRRSGPLKKRQLVIIFFLSSWYGLCLEGVQGFFLSDRYFEIPDIIANIIGSFVGILIVYIFYRKKQHL